MSPKNHRLRRRARRISRFINMANQSRVSRFINNNSNTICRIIRIPTLQITNNDFEDDFLNGTTFHDNDSLELSFSPAGFSTSFFP
jgi:hypothetical protein